MTMQSALALGARLASGELRSEQLVNDAFTRIDAVDGQVNAYLTLLRNDAIAQARDIDARRQRGERLGQLAGIPISIKDNIAIKGVGLTCGSKMLRQFTSPYDATVVHKLRAAGLIPVGKANMDEFAMGSSTENSAYFASKNPWDRTRVPGGSSGGSAASVAAGTVPLSLGSDTGGSIRQPASFCGVVGMKPTYGRVSRYGLVAFASSLDQIGPFSRTVEDTAALLSVICGHDPLDSTSSTTVVPDFSAALSQPSRPLKIGVPKQLFGDAIDALVLDQVKVALDVLKDDGMSWEMVDMPSFQTSVPTYYIIAPAEASANLSRFDGVRYTYRDETAPDLPRMYRESRGQGFGDEVKRRILIGTFVLSSGYYDAYYIKAQRARTLFKQDFERAFQDYDVLLTPTTPSTAFKFGEHERDPKGMYLADVATIPVNLAGLPALSLPCGFSDGLPVGMQLIGRYDDETTILQLGHRYQQLTDHHVVQAPIHSGEHR